MARSPSLWQHRRWGRARHGAHRDGSRGDRAREPGRRRGGQRGELGTSARSAASAPPHRRLGACAASPRDSPRRAYDFAAALTYRVGGSTFHDTGDHDRSRGDRSDGDLECSTTTDPFPDDATRWRPTQRLRRLRRELPWRRRRRSAATPGRRRATMAGLRLPRGGRATGERASILSATLALLARRTPAGCTSPGRGSNEALRTVAHCGAHRKAMPSCALRRRAGALFERCHDGTRLSSATRSPPPSRTSRRRRWARVRPRRGARGTRRTARGSGSRRHLR